MIEQLKAIYPSLVKLNERQPNYYSFLHNGQWYGIPISDLSEEAIELLDAFLPAQTHSQDELEWRDFLNGCRDEPPFDLDAYRLLVIAIEQPLDHLLLKETLEDILSKSLITIEPSSNTVFIIEPLETDEVPLSFTEIVDILSSDLEVKLRIFESDKFTKLELLPKLFHWTNQVAPVALQSTHQRVITQKEALLPKMMNQLTEEDQLFFIESIVKEAKNDEELLHTIKTVIKHQINISMVAKELYMHRNTVQKRIDKFQDLTGLDIRQFDDSLKAYICIEFLS
ncbi:PucR family transcriptional regulator [Alkalibacillus aidingensis]|uniref:PucR family transcriptional regulator n=1 Tax=Alkalibacillus aidingensis TaxID=2747607 RepID=UPI0016603F08|nr:helix-turn-helix domain-containing protein [Alkalibacillus aidingensis]